MTTDLEAQASLLHHPFDLPQPFERSKLKAILQMSVDVVQSELAREYARRRMSCGTRPVPPALSAYPSRSQGPLFGSVMQDPQPHTTLPW
jgi:hypothetical protein